MTGTAGREDTMNASSPKGEEGPRIEVMVAAPVDEVWQALRKPDLIRR
jgi:hypothetical protein